MNNTEFLFQLFGRGRALSTRLNLLLIGWWQQLDSILRFFWLESLNTVTRQHMS